MINRIFRSSLSRVPWQCSMPLRLIALSCLALLSASAALTTEQSWQGKLANSPDHKRATIGIMNVYAADDAARLPEGIKVKWLRIVQVIPQMLDDWFSLESVSQVSFATDSIGRMPLGVVPVEEVGSVYCEAPVGKALYFQLLDESGMAVHSMRSATYVHPGVELNRPPPNTK